MRCAASLSVFLSDLDLPSEFRETITEHMVLAHQSVREYSAKFYDELRRHNYVTPKNYLDFISNYKRSLVEQKDETRISPRAWTAVYRS